MRTLAKEIRLRYTGLIMFASRVVGLLTGLAFVTMVTRNVSLSEYGVWQYIFLVVSYFVLPNQIINYWLIRYIARQFKAAETGLIMNIIFSALSCTALLYISPYLAETVSTDPLLFIIGSLAILAMYPTTSLEAVARGSNPHINAYGFLAFEIAKIVLGAVTILYMKTGIYGALVSVVIAHIAQAIFLFINLRSRLTRSNLDWNTAKIWLRTSWIPLYALLAPVLISLDVLIVTLLTSSADPIALWQAGATITQVLGYSSLLTYGLYPKLLAGGTERDVETSLRLVLMFTVPSAIGAILLAEPLLWIFGYEYKLAANILRTTTLSVFLISIGNIWNSVIGGTEKADTEEMTFKKLLRSRLFLLPTLTYAKAFIYLPLVCVVTLAIINTHLEPVYLNVALACNVLSLLTLIPIFIYTYRLARRILPFKFPVKPLVKYVLASLVLLIIIIPFYPIGFARTIASVAISALAYFLILYVIDNDTRDLIGQIMATFKTRWAS